jgi:hypothetical protein
VSEDLVNEVNQMNYPTRYEITPKGVDYVLYSVVTRSDTWAGDNHEFKNFVCRGTKEYCEEIKKRLEGG